jgi:hypothetical protein
MQRENQGWFKVCLIATDNGSVEIGSGFVGRWCS